jgi:hypothetical protein
MPSVPSLLATAEKLAIHHDLRQLRNTPRNAAIVRHSARENRITYIIHGFSNLWAGIPRTNTAYARNIRAVKNKIDSAPYIRMPRRPTHVMVGVTGASCGIEYSSVGGFFGGSMRVLAIHLPLKRQAR